MSTPDTQRKQVLDYLPRATPEERRVAQELADGYGPLAPDDDRKWHWEHVSRSTDAGIERIHNYLDACGAF
jgi:hypothetical protein